MGEDGNRADKGLLGRPPLWFECDAISAQQFEDNVLDQNSFKLFCSLFFVKILIQLQQLRTIKSLTRGRFFPHFSSPSWQYLPQDERCHGDKHVVDEFGEDDKN